MQSSLTHLVPLNRMYLFTELILLIYLFGVDFGMCKYRLVKVAASTEIDLSEIEMYARHLIYWRRARTIIPVHRRGIYIVAPTAPLSNLASHKKIFARKFPGLPSLPRLLHSISAHEPRPFGNLIPEHALRETYLEALAWMLRYGYLAQIRTFIWLRISSKVKKAAAEAEAERKEMESDDEDEADIVFHKLERKDNDVDEDTILNEPERANVLERSWMDKIVEGQSARTREMFWKVVKYMNGRCAFEDIAGREGIDRRDMRQLLAAIKEHIIVSRHW